MCAVEVQSKNEVTLFGNRYRIEGRVQEQSLPNFAPKQLFGDPSRQDQVMVGQWIMNDWRDGMGTYDYQEQNTTASFYESTAETRIRGQLRLPRLQNSASGITGVSSLATTEILTWGTTDYVAHGSIVFKQTGSGTAATVFSPFGTAPGPISDAIVFHNNFFCAAGTAGFYWHNGSSWTTQSAATAHYFTEFDNKLVALSDDGTGLIKLKSTTVANPGAMTGADWTNNATIGNVTADARKLVVYVNAKGEDAIWVLTRWGVRVVDFGTQVIYFPKALQFPDGHTDNCRAFAVSYGGGEAFLSAKQIVYRISGQNVYPLNLVGEQITNTEPVAGFSSTRRGRVMRLIPTERYMLAVIDSTAADTSSILAWNGRGWHTITTVGNNLRTAFYSRSTPLGDVLWFHQTVSQNNLLYYITLPDVSDNPYMYQATSVQNSAVLTTSWFDANFAEIDKVALALDIRKRNAGGSIITYYGFDYDDSTLTSFATITNTGATTIPINSQAGTVFRAIRFQYDLRGGGTVDPIMEFASLKYALSPDKLKGWRMTLDLTKKYKGMTPQDLLDAIKTADDTKTLGVFSFKPNEDHYVRIMQKLGKEETGLHGEGKYELLVAELV